MTTEFSGYDLEDSNPTSNTFTMPPMVDTYPAHYGFGTNNAMPFYPFDSESQQQAMVDPSIMWGGMSQMSAQQPDPKLQHSTSYVSHYGQITPPNDINPTDKPDEQEAAESNEQNQEESAPKAKSRRPKREPTKRKSKSADTEDSSKSAKTTRKARKGYKATTKEEEEDSEGEAKREKFLERNRVAASKCRQKKKEWTGDLEQRARDLQNENTRLHSFALQLRDEVLSLKGECLKHTDCNCTRIREYLDRSIAGMNPSGALHTGPIHGMPMPGNPDYRKQSEASAYTFNSTTSGTATDSRQGSLALVSEEGQDMLANEDELMNDINEDDEMKALLKASIASPAGSSPASTGER